MADCWWCMTWTFLPSGVSGFHQESRLPNNVIHRHYKKHIFLTGFSKYVPGDVLATMSLVPFQQQCRWFSFSNWFRSATRSHIKSFHIHKVKQIVTLYHNEVVGSNPTRVICQWICFTWLMKVCARHLRLVLTWIDPGRWGRAKLRLYPNCRPANRPAFC